MNLSLEEYTENIIKLPPEIILHIVEYLTRNDLLRTAATCHTLREIIINEAALWDLPTGRYELDSNYFSKTLEFNKIYISDPYKNAVFYKVLNQFGQKIPDRISLAELGNINAEDFAFEKENIFPMLLEILSERGHLCTAPSSRVRDSLLEISILKKLESSDLETYPQLIAKAGDLFHSRKFHPDYGVNLKEAANKVSTNIIFTQMGSEKDLFCAANFASSIFFFFLAMLFIWLSIIKNDNYTFRIIAFCGGTIVGSACKGVDAKLLDYVEWCSFPQIGTGSRILEKTQSIIYKFISNRDKFVLLTSLLFLSYFVFDTMKQSIDIDGCNKLPAWSDQRDCLRSVEQDQNYYLISTTGVLTGYSFIYFCTLLFNLITTLCKKAYPEAKRVLSTAKQHLFFKPNPESIPLLNRVEEIENNDLEVGIN
jgi:hypothetical protein